MHTNASCKILITGFGPFPGMRNNPSQWLVQSIASGVVRLPSGLSVATAILPTSWQKVEELAPDLLTRHQPAIALHFGVHGKTRGFRIERIARNRTKQVPDVDGKLPPCTHIRRDGVRTLRSAVAGEKITVPLRTRGLDAELSNDAGSYLCNMLFYLSQLELRNRNAPGDSLFIHIPPARTALARRNLIKGVEVIIRTCAINVRH